MAERESHNCAMKDGHIEKTKKEAHLGVDGFFPVCFFHRGQRNRTLVSVVIAWPGFLKNLWYVVATASKYRGLRDEKFQRNDAARRNHINPRNAYKNDHFSNRLENLVIEFLYIREKLQIFPLKA